jgi:hypothetical protein
MSRRLTALLLTRRELASTRVSVEAKGNGEGSVGCSSELGSRAERNSVALCRRCHGRVDGPRGARGGTA